MDGISFAVGVASAADICIRFGKQLIHKYREFKNANERITELIVSIEGVWVKTEVQIAFLHRIANSLGDRLASYQDDALLQLSLKLQAAVDEVDHIFDAEILSDKEFGDKRVDLRFWKRARYSLFEKSLQANVTLLEEWHKRFDPSWYLITLIADTTIDLKLQDTTLPASGGLSALKEIRAAIHRLSHIGSGRPFLPPASATLTTPRRHIPGSSASTTTIAGSLNPVIIDRTAFPPGIDLPTASAQVADLVRLLSATAPETLGLLTCIGAIQVHQSSTLSDTLAIHDNSYSSQFELLFRLPDGVKHHDQVHSLRALLAEGREPSLDTKFKIAAALARGVLAVHAAGFVHKNIRPETVVVVDGGKHGPTKTTAADDAANGGLDSRTFGETSLTPYLLGFSQFRHVALESAAIGDMVWQRNLYRHPKRQGILPEETYSMYHDVYSLGVLLLEIGLWTSFVGMEEAAPKPARILGLEEAIEEKNVKRAAVETKSRLLALASKMLPSRMGINYTKVAISCLTALDKGKGQDVLADKVDEADLVTIGLQFVEEVLLKLENVQL